MRGKSIRAFTLIEVLVVVAIIALLISVLLPSLTAAKEQANVVVCKTRLLELYKGHVFYAQDYKQHFPDYDWWLWDSDQLKFFPGLYNRTGGSRPGGDQSDRWVEFGHIYKYVKNKEVYFCPKDTKKRAGPYSIGGGTNGKKPIHSFVRFREPHAYYAAHIGAEPNKIVTPAGDLYKSNFIGPDDLKARAFDPQKSYDNATPLNATPNRVGLLFEEIQNFGEPPIYVSTNIESALNDGNSGFMVLDDFLSMRHRLKSNMLFWDGHVSLVDAVKFNHYRDKYGTFIATGGTNKFSLP